MSLESPISWAARSRTWAAPDRVRFALGAAAGVSLVSVVVVAAGAIRLLALLVDTSLPVSAAWPVVSGLIALSVELGVLFGWPLAWTELALRIHERGEARTRFALGESPWQRLARLWPVITLLTLLGALGSFVWGRQAHEPAQLVRRLISATQETCRATREARVVAVPFINGTWLCRPGMSPVLIGELPTAKNPRHSVNFTARELSIASDFSSIGAQDVDIEIAGKSPARIRVRQAVVRGLPISVGTSSVGPLARAVGLAVSALFCALAGAHAALRGKPRTRLGAYPLALVGPSVAALTLRLCEQRTLGTATAVVVPAACLVAVAGAHLLAWSLHGWWPIWTRGRRSRRDA